ncbi:MAG: MopE-related protein [Polyangiales bacterium]
MKPSLPSFRRALAGLFVVAAAGCADNDAASDPNRRDAASDLGDARDVAAPDAAPDTAPDTAPDMALDVAPDAAPDIAEDASPDVAADAAPDLPLDAPGDAAPDAPADEDRDGVPAPRDCDDHDARVHPGAAEVCDDGVDNDCDGAADFAAASCQVPHCGDVTVDTTWRRDRLHVVTCDVHVQGAAAPTLTLEGGARVEFVRDVGLYVGEADRGRLVADGTATPITLTSHQAAPAAGDWTGLTLGANDQRSALTQVTVSFAGSELRGGVHLARSSPTLSRVTARNHAGHGVFADVGAAPVIADSTLSDNGGDGLFVALRASLGGAFERNTVTRNGRYAVTVPSSQAHQLDASSRYGGNRTDRASLVGDAITRDVAWQRLDVDYLVTGTVAVASIAGATLTVRDGVTARFAAGAGVTAGGANPGALVVEGGTAGVTFTSAAAMPARGDWAGVFLNASSLPSTLAGLSVLYAGSDLGAVRIASPTTLRSCTVRDSARHGVHVQMGGVATISNTTASNNALDGVFVASNAALALADAPTFDRNTLRDNGGHPVTVPANFVGQLAATGTYAPNGTGRVRVTGDYVERSAAWRALDAPYLLAEGFNVEGADAPRVTVEDGATFYAAAGVQVYVGEGMPGTLVAEGATRGVRFTSAAAAPAAGDWPGLYFGTRSAGSRLTRTTVEFAGASPARGAVTVYWGTLTVADSALQDSEGYGLYLFTNGTATVTGTSLRRNALGGLFASDTAALGAMAGGSFARNTVTANRGAPVSVTAALVGELDPSSSLTGNAEDVVTVRGATLRTGARWRALGVPYRVTQPVTVQALSGSAVIAIDAGARLRFDRGAGLTIADNAGLRVAGTAAEPVVFTSSAAAPARGDWLGIKLGNNCRSEDVDLAGLQVLYGGAQTYGPGTAGAIWWIDCAGSIRDSVIADSATWGLFRVRAAPAVTGLTWRNNALGDLSP